MDIFLRNWFASEMRSERGACRGAYLLLSDLLMNLRFTLKYFM